MTDLRTPVLRAGTALAAIPGGVLYALVVAGRIDPFLASDLMAVCVTVGLYAVVAAPFLPNGTRPKDRRSRTLELLLVWTTASAVAQLCWELPFALLHSWLDGATEHDRWAWLWWAYGVADSRYITADPFVVCMEGFTAAVGGPIELWCIWRMRNGDFRGAALATILVGATQWYGTVLYFGVEAFTGFAHVSTASFLDWGLKFFALNALWLALPVVQVSTAVALLREQPATSTAQARTA